MKKKILVFALVSVIFTFLGGTIAYKYAITFFEEKYEAQQRELKLVHIKVERHEAEIESVQEKIPELSSFSIDFKEDDKEYTGNKELLGKLSDDVSEINKKIKSIDLEQQRLAAEFEKHPDRLVDSTLSQRQRNNNSVLDVTQSPDEFFARGRERVEGIVQNLEAHWQQQEVASTWAQSTETVIRDIVGQSKGLEVNDVNCRTDLCRLEMIPTEELEGSATEWLMSDTSSLNISEAFTQTKTTSDGATIVIMYLAKEGSFLPKIPL